MATIDGTTALRVGDQIAQGTKTLFGHTFGEAASYRGTVPIANGPAVHLLFRFDLSDPGFPLKAATYAWLPVFVAFRYDASPLGYLVTGDDEIKIIHLERRTITNNFPYVDFPVAFGAIPLTLAAIPYEQLRAFAFGRLLERYSGPGALSKEDQGLYAELAASDTVVGAICQLLVNVPRMTCVNRDCPDHGLGYPLSPLLAIGPEPLPGVDLWQAGGEPLHIVCYVCQTCDAVLTLTVCS